ATPWLRRAEARVAKPVSCAARHSVSRLRHVACEQMLNTIGTQRSAAGTGKQPLGISSALLPNPSFQDGGRGLGQRRAAFLASFSPATHVCASSERDVLVAQPGHFG